MQSKSENKKRSDNEKNNSKSPNVFTWEADKNMNKPVRGLPKK